MLSLKQLIDLDTLQHLLDRFYRLTGFRAGMVDTQGTILISTGAPDICMDFHRSNPITARRCLQSDLMVSPGQCRDRGYFTYTCANGFMHCGVPVVVREQQLGTFFLGSFLFEAPDIEVFKAQAEEVGFDVQAYLAALEAVPVLNPEQVDQAMGFYLDLVDWVARIGLQKLRLQETMSGYQDLQERYALALSGSREGIWDWDLKNDKVSFSPRWKEILGFADHELPNTIQTWKDLIHPDDFQKVMQANMSLFTPGVEHFSVQYRMQHKSGRYLWILGRGTCVRDDTGLPVRLTGTHTDITPHKEAEKELWQEKKMDAVTTLAGGVAHEFNNILQGISGNTQLLQTLLPPEGREQNYLNKTLSSVSRASELIDELLSYSQQALIKKDRIDLNAIARETADHLRPLFEDRLSLEVELDSELEAIPGDPGQLEQVLHIMIQNAEEAIPSDRWGTVRIETRKEEVKPSSRAGLGGLEPGPYARLRIADNGCGIDRHHRQQVFDPFFTTKDPGQGTGLGLSTVYSVVQAHRGHITCSSTPDQGTAFTILLPVLTPGRESSSGCSQPGAPQRDLKVLVADNDDLVLETVCEALQWVHMSIIRARSGQEMLQQCRDPEQPIQALVCDLKLCQDGSTNWVKALLNEIPAMPVVIVGSSPSSPTMTELEQAGVSSFIAKPFKHEQLLSAIYSAIQKHSPSQ